MDRVIGSHAVLVMILVLVLKSKASRQCDEPWDEFGEAHFQVIVEPKTWSSAQTNCQNEGARLAWIDTVDEDRFIAERTARLADTAWIGLRTTRAGRFT